MMAFVDECAWWQEPQYERAVHALLVIGSLERNQKLCTESDDMFSSAGYYFGQSVVRCWSGEGRDTNLSAVRRVIREAEEALALARAMRRNDDGGETEHGAQKLAARMTEALRTSMAGLDNLKHTYAADARAVARIRLLERHVNDILRDNSNQN